MRADEFREFLIEQPFQPFRVTLTDGRTYDVVHPEMAMVTRSLVTIGIPGDGEGNSPIADRLTHVSLLHIMQIDLIDTPSQSGSDQNGAPG